MNKKVADRFWAKVDKTGSCWLWKGATKSKGYGNFWFNGRGCMAHRISLQIAGIHIPQGMVVDHICRERLCVNPDHLRLVTPEQNNFENSESITAKLASRTHCSRGHLLAGDNLLPDKSRRGRTCWTCMRLHWAKSNRKISQRKRDERRI